MTPVNDSDPRAKSTQDMTVADIQKHEDQFAAHKTLVRQSVEAIVNDRNLTSIQAEPGLTNAMGRIRWLLTALPDARVSIDWQVAEGEWVVTGVTCRGTHLGDWEGLPPTGKPVTLRLILRHQVAHGHIVSLEVLYDLLPALEQLGAQLVLRQPA